MYYYILESPSSRAVRQNYQRLRDTLTNLGIAGEMVMASPARTPAELTRMGIHKGYSTIVAVGNDSHINQVATSIHDEAVLGIVPIEATQQVTELIGYNDIRSSAEALKHRRLITTNLVVAEPETLIFLDAHIIPPQLAKVSMVIDSKVRVNAYFHEMTITRDLEIIFSSRHITEKRKVLGFFEVGGKEVRSQSSFHGKTIRILTEPTLPISVAGTPVANTPIQFRLIPESLKLITKRGTILE